MKFLIGLLAISLAWNGARTLPARSPSDDAEVIAVPKQRPASGDDGTDFRNYNGVIDTGVGYPFLQPNPHPFSFNFGFFDSFEDIFRRLRTHLIPVERPSIGDGSDSSEEADCLDAKKFNETSSVKIVDGLKIEVNETVYGDDNSSFKIRIINVRPVGSGDNGDEAATTETGESSPDPDYRKTVTSAPAPKKNKDREEIEADGDDNDDDDDNDERREPLAKSPAENEHLSDEQYALTTTMLPATSDADNAANLNAAFVTDNSLEMGEASEQHGSGNIESETNKPDDVTSEQRDEAALDVEQQPHGDAVNSRLLANERPTIENNEESEVNDNFNESPTDANIATAAAEDDFTENLHELQLSGQDGGESLANDGSDIVEDVAHIDDSDADGADVVERMATHSNYKQREDVASSDDDSDAEKVEMTPEFYAEWSELAGESTNGDDSRRQAVEHNDLDNEIDAYDSVPVDLSNDIGVNDIAAAQSDYPRNPDAEFIDVDGMMMSESMPKFERLSSIDSPIRSTSYQPAGYAHNMK